MQNSPPRLQINDPSAVNSYAPISWMGVASAALGGLFIFATVFLAYSAYARKQPMMESWLLGLAAISVVLAFVARRQILASEGTMVGMNYANFGWWVGVVGFLGYAAYLTAIEFSFRREVDTAFRQNWAQPLSKINPFEYKDPSLYSAVFMTLPLGARADLNRNDIASIDRRFEAMVSRFRASDLVKLAGRNSGNITFTDETILDWSMDGNRIDCKLGVIARTAEGTHQLVIPMNAMPDDRKIRYWQMMIPEEGYIKGRQLTAYGWWIDYLQVSGEDAANNFLNTLGTPGKHPVAYNGYVIENADVLKAEKLYSDIIKSGVSRAAVGGNLAAVTSFTNRDTLFPMPQDWQKTLAEQLFAKPSGLKLTGDELRTFMFSWLRPRSIIPGGLILKNLNDSKSTLLINDQVLELKVPVEIVLGEDPNRPSAAKGVMTLQLVSEELKDVRAEMEKAKAQGATFLANPPTDLKTRQTHWRVIRIESDLRMLQPPAQDPKGQGGMPGMMPGMMS